MLKNMISGVGALATVSGMALANPAGCVAAASEAETARVIPVSLLADDIVDTAVAAGQFKTLAAALQAAGLVQALKGPGPFTVFAPTDEAFAKLPAGTVENLLKPENRALLVSVLTYHVTPGELTASEVTGRLGASTLNGQRVDFAVRGGSAMVNGAKVVKADIRASNGVIHVIDTVILPSTDDVVTIAQNAGTFKTLLAAAQAAGLVDALKGPGPITVFAPTDEAFAKLPAGTVESLLKPENKQKLSDILKYHVVSGRVYARDAVMAERAPTLLGAKVTARVMDGRLKINGASVVKSDIQASNGVIHVIDAVLLPE
ncbi:MAG: fasciclin domain-containing protein [Phycisphaeraceae bacterium]|nr:fasciclin domain-containing protein [Phycisphaeraceae bacterium]